MNEIQEFTHASPRPLPVIILADISGSMANEGKIQNLNNAVSEMIGSFREEQGASAQIQVAVVTFGGREAELHTPLTSAESLAWKDMTADGRTPMGSAFELVTEMLEDRNQIPGRAYRPTLVLISDGIPTDTWEGPLQTLLASPRASKATRFAMAIGSDACHDTLEKFLGDSPHGVFEAHQAREIRKFFKWVTMSVTTRTRSTNPNQTIALDFDDIDDVEF